VPDRGVRTSVGSTWVMRFVCFGRIWLVLSVGSKWARHPLDRSPGPQRCRQKGDDDHDEAEFNETIDHPSIVACFGGLREAFRGASSASANKCFIPHSYALERGVPRWSGRCGVSLSLQALAAAFSPAVLCGYVGFRKNKFQLCHTIRADCNAFRNSRWEPVRCSRNPAQDHPKGRFAVWLTSEQSRSIGQTVVPQRPLA
jgi:hypothetical protein